MFFCRRFGSGGGISTGASHRRRGSGFTLVELVVLLLVVGVIAAIALPRSNTDPVLVATQADQLANDIRYVQSLAMTQGQRYRINFVSASSYTFTTASGAAVPHPFTGSTSPTALSPGVTMTLPPANLPNNLVGFDGLGVPYTDAAVSTALASTAVITLAKGAATATVSITPQTGRVHVP